MLKALLYLKFIIIEKILLDTFVTSRYYRIKIFRPGDTHVN